MTLTTADLYLVRSWVGTSPTDAVLQERATATGGTALQVARGVLQERLADLLASPESFSVDGDYTESQGANIAALRTQVADLSVLIDGSPVPGLTSTADDPAVEPPALQRGDRERLWSRNFDSQRLWLD